MVLTLCNASLTLVTGAQLEPRGGFAAPSSSSAGNTIHDGQLHAWKIPPAQFRPLLGAVKKLNEELSGLDSQRQECSGLFAELVQALNSCS